MLTFVNSSLVARKVRKPSFLCSSAIRKVAFWSQTATESQTVINKCIRKLVMRTFKRYNFDLRGAVVRGVKTKTRLRICTTFATSRFLYTRDYCKKDCTYLCNSIQVLTTQIMLFVCNVFLPISCIVRWRMTLRENVKEAVVPPASDYGSAVPVWTHRYTAFSNYQRMVRVVKSAAPSLY